MALWIRPLRLVTESPQGNLVLAGDRHVVRWVSRRYRELILEACSSAGRGVEFIVAEESP